MLRFLISIFLIILIAIGSYVFFNSQNTFEAKFKNIDGLPKGAQVTALGVRIGEVIRTKPTNDGIIVTVKIKNKKFHPIPGSQLTITSFRPNQGRIFEIVPPNIKLEETNAWIVQEPVTIDSWLHASIELLDGLKSFSSTIIKQVTPEHFEAARLALQEASDSLNRVAVTLFNYEQNLVQVRETFEKKTDEANSLVLKLKKPIESLNKVINDKNLAIISKDQLKKITNNLNDISANITNPDFQTNLSDFKTNILDHLNQINDSLSSLDQKVTDPTLTRKIKTFNEHLKNLNAFYGNISKDDIQKIKLTVKKASEAATDLESKVSKLQEMIAEP